MINLTDQELAERKRLQQLRHDKITEACKDLKELFPEGFALFVNAELGPAKGFGETPFAFVPQPSEWFVKAIAASISKFVAHHCWKKP